MRKALLLAPLILTSVGVTAFDLDSLLRHSVGGESSVEVIKNIKTYHATGEVILNGEQGEFVHYSVLPDHLYFELRFDDFNIVQGFDGLTAWQRDMNGQVSEISGLEKGELLKSLYIGSYAYLFPDSASGSQSYSGQIEIDGERYHEVVFCPPELDTIHAFFGTRTGFLRSITSRMDQIKAIQTFDDYRNSCGFYIPFMSRASLDDVPFDAEFRTESVEINQPIGLSIFSMPPESSTDFHFPDSIKEVRIPFDYIGGHIRLPITVNGSKTAQVFLDSGASINILHRPFLAGLNLKPIGKLPAMGMGGFEEVDLIKTDSLAVGQLTLYDQVAGCMDLGSLQSFIGENADFGGLLGYDFLSRFPMLIDYQNQLLTVYDPRSFVPPDGGIEVTFHLTMQVPTVQGKIESVGGDFLVDLGNSLGLVIHEQFARENNIEEKILGVIRDMDRIGGIGGAVSGTYGLVASFSVGDAVFSDALVVLPDSGHGVVGSLRLAGNVGNPLLESFKVLLDYKGSRIIFYPLE